MGESLRAQFFPIPLAGADCEGENFLLYLQAERINREERKRFTSMPRFFIDYEPGKMAEISGEDGRHIARSLRMQPGEELTLCDGRGKDYQCRILRIQGDTVEAEVLSVQPTLAEPTVQVTLYQGLPKSDKFEWVVQKAVELGVTRIVPVLTARCVSRPDDRSMAKKQERWQKIAQEAAKQSGRGILPVVGEKQTFSQALEEGCCRQKALLFYEGGGERIVHLVEEGIQSLSLFIGPEGGFAPEEVQLAKEMGVFIATLGPRILRTETAPLAALAGIMQATGNL